MKRTKKMKMMKTNLQKKKMGLKLTTLRMTILKLQRIRRMAKTIVMKRKMMTKRKKWMLRKARLTKPLTR